MPSKDVSTLKYGMVAPPEATLKLRPIKEIPKGIKKTERHSHTLFLAPGCIRKLFPCKFFILQLLIPSDPRRSVADPQMVPLSSSKQTVMK